MIESPLLSIFMISFSVIFFKTNYLPSYQYQSINTHSRTRWCQTLSNLWEFGCGTNFQACTSCFLPKFLGSGKPLVSASGELYNTCALDKILNLLESQWIRECPILGGPCHRGILLENSGRYIKIKEIGPDEVYDTSTSLPNLATA